MSGPDSGASRSVTSAYTLVSGSPHAATSSGCSGKKSVSWFKKKESFKVRAQ